MEKTRHSGSEAMQAKEVPSGDQTGEDLRSEEGAIRTASPPSTGTVQIELCHSKARVRPSGESAGLDIPESVFPISPARPEATDPARRIRMTSGQRPLKREGFLEPDELSPSRLVRWVEGESDMAFLLLGGRANRHLSDFPKSRANYTHLKKICHPDVPLLRSFPRSPVRARSAAAARLKKIVL